MISIYKLQNVSPYCLKKQVNKILGIRNSEIWLFDDVSKIYVPSGEWFDLGGLLGGDNCGFGFDMLCSRSVLSMTLTDSCSLCR